MDQLCHLEESLRLEIMTAPPRLEAPEEIQGQTDEKKNLHLSESADIELSLKGIGPLQTRSLSRQSVNEFDSPRMIHSNKYPSQGLFVTVCKV